MSTMIEYDVLAVGRVIRKIRNAKGLSQEVFSGLAGMARSHLAMIEAGSKKANLETIWRIANAFEMHPHELIKQIEQDIATSKKRLQV